MRGYQNDAIHPSLGVALSVIQFRFHGIEKQISFIMESFDSMYNIRTEPELNGSSSVRFGSRTKIFKERKSSLKKKKKYIKKKNRKNMNVS